MKPITRPDHKPAKMHKDTFHQLTPSWLETVKLLLPKKAYDNRKTVGDMRTVDTIN